MPESFYDKLCNEDWVQYFKDEFENLKMRFDSKGRFWTFNRLTPDTPWLNNKCTKHMEIYNKCTIYNHYFGKKIGFVHSVCYDCYKVVVKPRTVKELFQFYDYQQGVDMPGKCGIERRPYVPRLYGGYFYNRGLENGRKCWQQVSKSVANLISPDIPIILKRGCTELEMTYGPSNKWKKVPDQKKWEDEFNERYCEDTKVPEDDPNGPEYLQAHIKREWIHWAAMAKPPDITYLEFTDGKYLVNHCEYVTYHDREPFKEAEEEEKREKGLQKKIQESTDEYMQWKKDRDRGLSLIQVVR